MYCGKPERRVLARSSRITLGQEDLVSIVITPKPTVLSASSPHCQPAYCVPSSVNIATGVRGACSPSIEI